MENLTYLFKWTVTTGGAGVIVYLIASKAAQTIAAISSTLTLI